MLIYKTQEEANKAAQGKRAEARAKSEAEAKEKEKAESTPLEPYVSDRPK